MTEQAFSGRARTAFFFAVAIIAVALLYWLQTVLLLAFLGLLIAIVLDAIARPGIRFLKMPRGVAVTIAAGIFVVVIVGTLALLIVPLMQERNEFMQALPEKLENVSNRIEQYRRDFPSLKSILPTLKGDSKADATTVASNAVGTASSVVEWTMEALATFFLAIYLAWNPERWLRGVAELWPRGSPENRIALYRKIGDALRSYLFSIAVYIIAMGSLWTVGLWLIGIPYALLFGTIGGLVEIAPYIGPVLGLIPPLIFSATLGTKTVLYVVGLYVLLHIIEGYVLVPYLMHRREHLPPPVVLLSILACGAVFGVMGVIVAVPLGTVIYVLADETIYQHWRKDKNRG